MIYARCLPASKTFPVPAFALSPRVIESQLRLVQNGWYILGRWSGFCVCLIASWSDQSTVLLLVTPCASERAPTFRRNISPPSLGLKTNPRKKTSRSLPASVGFFLALLFETEDRGHTRMFLRNVGAVSELHGVTTQDHIPHSHRCGLIKCIAVLRSWLSNAPWAYYLAATSGMPGELLARKKQTLGR
jgi:hypothetical protein